METISAIFLVLSILGGLYYVLSTAALVSHFRPAGKAESGEWRDESLKISVLKPVAGIDAAAEENLRSYLNLDYPDYEVLFGVLDSQDSAVPILQRIVGNSGRASLYVGSRIEGSNNKVRILDNLSAHATGDILLITDSVTRNITIPPGKRLFFPVINYFDLEWGSGTPPKMGHWDTPPGYWDGVYESAEEMMADSAGSIYAIIDGKSVRNLTAYRTTTPVFCMWLPRENLLTFYGISDIWGYLDQNMTDGYYLLLEPLKPGKHTVEFGETDWPLNITYHITVKCDKRGK